MPTTLSRKGQVTIPKPIRELLGLQTGSLVDFRVTETGQVMLCHPETETPRSASRFATLRGTATIRMKTDDIMAMTRSED